MRAFDQALGRLGAQAVPAPPADEFDAEDGALLGQLGAQARPGSLFGRLASAWPRLHTTLAALTQRLVPMPALFKQLAKQRGRLAKSGKLSGLFQRRGAKADTGDQPPPQAVAGLRLPARGRALPWPRYLVRLREPASGPAWLQPAARPLIARLRRLALVALRRRTGLQLEQVAIAFAQAERDLAGEPQDPNARRIFLDLRHAAERAQLASSRTGVRRLGLEIGLKELDLKIAEGDAVGPAITGLRAQLREQVGRARLATEDAAIEAIVAEAAGALARVDRLVRPTGGDVSGGGPRAARLRAAITALQARLDAATDGRARLRLRLRLGWRRQALRHLA